MEFKLIKIEKPDDANFILGQSHFIKTVEDLHEAIVSSVPSSKFGIGFYEASGECLVRRSGNDPDLIRLAELNALNISAGHSFVIFLREAFPINILNSIKMVPEVCRIFCATANPVEVIVSESAQGRGILGVIDGHKPQVIESEKDVEERKSLLRKLGYKL